MTRTVNDHIMPDGRFNVMEYDIEEVKDGGATWWIKKSIVPVKVEVSDKEWMYYIDERVIAWLSRTR